MSKDASKEKHLESLGYVVFRINAADAKNRRRLREFASSVVKAYHEERVRESQRGTTLTRGIPQKELQQLKVKLEKEGQKEKQAENEAERLESIRAKKPTDEELFLQAIEDLSKRGRK
ncbi:MAG: hypothetical protein PHY13_03295 [Clostridia bacterium]|nr:hypothetical protein [Clostridia bacterium]